MIYKIDSFSVDKNYLHIIQNVSRDHTEEIYSYLYESAISIIEDFFSKKKLPKRLNRKNTFFYKKNSTLPVTIEVHSWVEYSVREGSTPGVHILIKFPVIHQNMNVKQIQEIYEEKLEKSLGLTDKVKQWFESNLWIKKWEMDPESKEDSEERIKQIGKMEYIQQQKSIKT